MHQTRKQVIADRIENKKVGIRIKKAAHMRKAERLSKIKNITLTQALIELM